MPVAVAYAAMKREIEITKYYLLLLLYTDKDCFVYFKRLSTWWEPGIQKSERVQPRKGSDAGQAYPQLRLP